MIRKSIHWGISLTEKHVILRYIISGGTSAATDLTLLYAFNTLMGIHYLMAAVLAYLVAFWVSFLLHKFWTFESHKERTHKQVIMYLGSSLFALALNTLLMYVLVDHFHLAVLVAQFFVGIIIAFCSFFISSKLVFKYQTKV